MTDLAVIMSIYHNDRLIFVKESVKSILNQTFRDFHYYIAFDGPVSEEIEDYMTSISDERIRLFKLEKNQGLAKALNFLLSKMIYNQAYRYIARMDADDISMPERFEKQRNFLIKNPEISVLGSWYEEIDEAGEMLSYKRLPSDHDQLRRRYLFMTPFAHSSVMFNRRLFEVCGLYPTDTYLMEDNFLWGKALVNNLRFSNLTEILLRFRVDRNFYKRRSGFTYGLNYIRTKLRISRMLELPAIYCLISCGMGILRMMPSFVFKSLR